MRILFVCLGNICRSPSAEGVMRHLIEREDGERAGEGRVGDGVGGTLPGGEPIELDSAGTGGWHVGEPPDPRASGAARRRGIELGGSARQVMPDDFERFDLILAMDRSNLSALQRLAPDERSRAKLRLLREFDHFRDGVENLDVPDPYYGGERGFDDVLDLLESACSGLLAELRSVSQA